MPTAEVSPSTRLFRALGSPTRRELLRILLRKEAHISGLARELRLSVPVVAKHCRILEDLGLLERRKFGSTHVLRAKFNSIYENFDGFSETVRVSVPRGASLLEALKQAGADVTRRGDGEYVVSIDGDPGLYLYEVDGQQPQVTVDKFVPEKDVAVVLKKLVTVTRKEIKVEVRDANGSENSGK
ncbi:MAG: helix-turn-helix domain-containing protein [Halobacteria archaeon]